MTHAQHKARLLALIGATALEIARAYWRGVKDHGTGRQCPYRARTIQASAWTVGAHSSP